MPKPNQNQNNHKNNSKPPAGKKTGKDQVFSYGPVENLEEYVRPDWWHGIFNQLYLKTDGDVVDDPKITEDEIDLFASVLNLQSDDKILDLCCGQGRHSLEMARRGLTGIEGLDRSHYLITRARSQADKEGLPVKFREGDARKLPQAVDSFDVVMVMGNSFGYFEAVEDDLQVLNEIARILKPGGRVFLDVTDGNFMRDNFERRSWEWIDQKHFVCRERTLSSDEQRLISREVITQMEKGVIADQFYAERLYSQDSLNALLEAAGFKNISFHGTLSTNSARNQDLGMMSHRILVSAEIQKNWTPKKTKASKPSTHVVVVMGDSSRPDSTKLNGVFDEDDFYTIDQMKVALGQLSEYKTTYLDNHGTLVNDLLKLQGKVDLIFNICDEGYNNEAQKELHVPALLEMLNLPYTGAGPQSLAFCYDKSLVRGIAKEIQVPVAPGTVIKPEDTTIRLPFKFPAILKPNKGDNSLGITRESVVYSPEELFNAVDRIRKTVGEDVNVLAEKFLTGKDLTCGLIGNKNNFIVLPIAEEDYSAIPDDWPKICGYEAKWLPDSPYWNLTSQAAKLTRRVEKIIVESSVKMFERLDCRDYARFDWRLDDAGNPFLLEVNPNPGWCWDGHLAKMAKLAGYTYAEMLNMILQAAVGRLEGQYVQDEELKIEYLTIKAVGAEMS